MEAEKNCYFTSAYGYNPLTTLGKVTAFIRFIVIAVEVT